MNESSVERLVALGWSEPKETGRNTETVVTDSGDSFDVVTIRFVSRPGPNLTETRKLGILLPVSPDLLEDSQFRLEEFAADEMLRVLEREGLC